jgi:histidinol-phosphate aminotransferase
LVRHFTQTRIANHLRISIGTQAECEHLVQALKRILAEQQDQKNEVPA